MRAALAAGLLAAALAGCAVPDVDRSIERSLRATPAPSEIHGAAGPLSAEESRAILAKLGIDESAGADGASFAAHLAIEQAVAGNPLSAENAVQVLPDGAAAFREISAVIRAARVSLNLEYYTIEDVILDDNLSLLDLLLSKRRQGVAVNIIYDSYGSSDTPSAFLDQLKAAGVNLLPFHPLRPGYLRNFNNRDHRKILVADGRVAILGGVNLSHSYESKAPFGGSEREEQEEHRETLGQALGLAPATLPSHWMDAAIRVEGPVVAQVQTLFRDHWKSESGPPLDETGFFPALDPKGDAVVRVLGSTPDQDISRYYVTVVSAMRNAQSSIWLMAAYFVPTEAEKKALLEAAHRGVDVRLLLPGESDSEKAIRTAETHYLDLLDGGVKIWRTRGVVLHTKCVVIDGVWSVIGSSNFDHRSVLFNDEVDAVILGRATAQELQQVFQKGTEHADPLDAETWAESRPVGERTRAFFARMLWESQL